MRQGGHLNPPSPPPVYGGQCDSLWLPLTRGSVSPSFSQFFSICVSRPVFISIHPEGKSCSDRRFSACSERPYRMAHRVGVRDARVTSACNSARVMLGDFHRQGLFGCSQSSERAAFYYHLAGEAGDARGMAWTGHSLFSGLWVVGTFQCCPPQHRIHTFGIIVSCVNSYMAPSFLECTRIP
jgi:hypothetical protein